MSKSTNALRKALDVLDRIDEILTKKGIIRETEGGRVTSMFGQTMGSLFEYRTTNPNFGLRWGFNFALGFDSDEDECTDTVLTSLELHFGNPDAGSDVPYLAVSYDVLGEHWSVAHEKEGGGESLQEIWSAFPEGTIADDQAVRTIEDLARRFLAGNPN